MTFAERLKLKRTQLGLSQAALTKEINKYCIKEKIVRTTVTMWENGLTKDISAKNLLRLSLVFGVSPYWLLFGKNRQRFITNKQLKK